MVSPIWLSLPMVEKPPKRKDIIPLLQIALNDLWTDAVKEFTEKGLATLIIQGLIHSKGGYIDTGMAGASLIAPIKLTKDPEEADKFIAKLSSKIRRSKGKPLLLRAGNQIPNGFRTINKGLSEGRKATKIKFVTRTNFLLDFEFEVAVWQLENIIQKKLDVVGAASDGFWDFFQDNVFQAVNRSLKKLTNVKVKEVKFRG